MAAWRRVCGTIAVASVAAPGPEAFYWLTITFSQTLGTALGEWPQFHVNAASIGSLAYLITGGSLIGYTSFIYLLEHVPMAKVASYCYVNPVVAVLLGILLLHERPEGAEFAGMAAVVVAVFLLTTARVKGTPPPIEELAAGE